MVVSPEIDARTKCIWCLYRCILNYFSLIDGTKVCLSETFVDRETFSLNKEYEF
ncbi:MAG: hypothetical protein Q4A70_00570 [Candidatus Saccharibacteria bacterium]|nr:hypothetical protein [Candidatus Saccharibacteria bacterium]